MIDRPALIVREVVEVGAVWREIAMLSSPSYRAMNKAAHQALACIEIAIADGRTRLRHDDFIGFGVSRGLVTYAIRELEGLGIIDVLRDPPHASQFSLSRRWRSITTFEQAVEVRERARSFGIYQRRKRERSHARWDRSL